MAREREYRHYVRCRHCGSNWMPKDGTHSDSKFTSTADRKRRQVVNAGRPHFPEHVKRQAVRMRAMSAGRASGRVAIIAVSTIAFDEMWGHMQALG